MSSSSDKEMNSDIAAAVTQMTNENIQFDSSSQTVIPESFDFMKSLNNVETTGVLNEINRSNRGSVAVLASTDLSSSSVSLTDSGTLLSRLGGIGKCGGRGRELFECATALLAKNSSSRNKSNSSKNSNTDNNTNDHVSNNNVNNNNNNNNNNVNNSNISENSSNNSNNNGHFNYLNNITDYNRENTDNTTIENVENTITNNNIDHNDTNGNLSTVTNKTDANNNKKDIDSDTNSQIVNQSQQQAAIFSSSIGARTHYSPTITVAQQQQQLSVNETSLTDQYSNMHVLNSSSSSAPAVPPHTPSSLPTAGATPSINLDEVYEYIADLTVSSKREKALLELSRRREMVPDLAPLLWYSFGVITAILQEIISIYAYLTPPNLTSISSNRVCNALALLQTVASHPDTRQAFLNAHIPLLLYPFLNTISMSRPFEYLRLTSLGVIGALVKMDDPEVIGFLLQTEIISLCLRIMEMGSELSKTVATFVVQKILLNDLGLRYVCATAERFYALSSVLGGMVTTLVSSPSSRLLKHIVKCYLRLTDNPRAREALKKCIPVELRDGSLIRCVKEDLTTRHSLVTLLSLIDSKAAKQLIDAIPVPTTNPPINETPNSEVTPGHQLTQTFRQQNPPIHQFAGGGQAQYQTSTFDTNTKAAIAAATAALQNANATRASNGSTTLDAATVETITAALKAVSTKTSATPSLPKLPVTQPY